MYKNIHIYYIGLQLFIQHKITWPSIMIRWPLGRSMGPMTEVELLKRQGGTPTAGRFTRWKNIRTIYKYGKICKYGNICKSINMEDL